MSMSFLSSKKYADVREFLYALLLAEPCHATLADLYFFIRSEMKVRESPLSVQGVVRC